MTEKAPLITTEREPTAARNESIRAAIAEGKLPMMPFERREVEVELLGHVATQKELAALRHIAMNTTSETWHDNAQADAVNMQAEILHGRGTEAVRALSDGVVVEYPTEADTSVTIGSLVTLTLGRAPMEVYLTGYRRYMTDEIQAVVGEDVDVANIQSPLGAALFDQSVGAEVAYAVGERQLQATILDIRHPAIAEQE